MLVELKGTLLQPTESSRDCLNCILVELKGTLLHPTERSGDCLNCMLIELVEGSGDGLAVSLLF
jgi:hypothetical protein